MIQKLLYEIAEILSLPQKNVILEEKAKEKSQLCVIYVGNCQSYLNIDNFSDSQVYSGEIYFYSDGTCFMDDSFLLEKTKDAKKGQFGSVQSVNPTGIEDNWYKLSIDFLEFAVDRDKIKTKIEEVEIESPRLES